MISIEQARELVASLPLYETSDVGEHWHGRGVQVTATYQNHYEDTPRTIQGRAYWNPKGYLVVRGADYDTVISLNILQDIQGTPRTYHSDALGAVTIPEDAETFPSEEGATISSFAGIPITIDLDKVPISIRPTLDGYLTSGSIPETMYSFLRQHNAVEITEGPQ